jgi:hypothetical protein
MEQSDVTNAASREDFDSLEVSLERVGSFDAEQRRHGAVSSASFDFGGGAGEAKLPPGSHDGVGKDVDLGHDGLRETAGGARHGKRHQAEELGPNATLAESRQVHVPRESRAPQGWVVARQHVVSEPARPEQRVRMQIDGRVGSVQRVSLR